MAYTATMDQTLSGSSLWHSLSSLRATLAPRLVQRRAYRETVKELAALSDRDLADVGVYRADIRNVAWQAVRAF